PADVISPDDEDVRLLVRAVCLVPLPGRALREPARRAFGFLRAGLGPRVGEAQPAGPRQPAERGGDRHGRRHRYLGTVQHLVSPPFQVAPARLAGPTAARLAATTEAPTLRTAVPWNFSWRIRLRELVFRVAVRSARSVIVTRSCRRAIRSFRAGSAPPGP